MLVGAPATFALESEITFAYARLSFRALGFFVIHISGHSFGVRAPDASMLACSFNEIARRLQRRGTHSARFANAEATALALSVREALYDVNSPAMTASGVPSDEFSEVLRSRRLLWAPDGDEAFDDSSYVLQFDTPEGVRLVGFKCLDTGLPDPATIAEVKLRSDSFYDVLARWHAGFEAEWLRTPKTPESVA